MLEIGRHQVSTSSPLHYTVTETNIQSFTRSDPLSHLFSFPGFEFFEASAKDNINVKQTFERLVDIICEKMSESLDAGDPAVTGAKQGPQLTEQPAPPHQDCAC